jgi:hypothetical protein
MPKPRNDAETISHTYHAKAEALSGHLKLPVEQKILAQAPTLLNTTRDTHTFQRAEKFNLEGLITVQSGYTHVSGNRSLKEHKNHGWVTLATSVLEGLNVINVITADRVVSQISTDHPRVNGHVPHVTFLGTHFENLRISGYPVEVELDFMLCGPRPEDRTPYTQSSHFLDRVKRHYESIANAEELPQDIRNLYDGSLRKPADLKSNGNGAAKKSRGNPVATLARTENERPQDQRWGDMEEDDDTPRVRCSLVKHISSIPIATSAGNVLTIPGFGTLHLATVDVSEKNYFKLTMLEMQLGCIGTGSVSAGSVSVNGHTRP